MKKIQIIGFILLFILSVIHSLRKPEPLNYKKPKELTVTVEGAFNQTGKIPIKEGMTMKDLVKKIGIKENASVKSINMNKIIHAEESYYLPVKQEHMISLNNATKKELMMLKGIGEKTADKIIEYRKKHCFEKIEDLKNIKGIGNQRFLKYRDSLSL